MVKGFFFGQLGRQDDGEGGPRWSDVGGEVLVCAR